MLQYTNIAGFQNTCISFFVVAYVECDTWYLSEREMLGRRVSL